MKHLLSIAFVALVAGCGGNSDGLPATDAPAPSQGTGTTTARKFEVFDANERSPVVTQTLSMDDPLLAAAIARAQR